MPENRLLQAIKDRKGSFCIRKWTEQNQNKARSCRNKKVKNKQRKQDTEKTNEIEQDKLFFFPSPTPLKKYKPTFFPNVPTFRDFLPCFFQNLPTPHKIPFTTTRRTRAYAYTHAHALSEFAIFAFTLHLTPQQAVDQSVECEGKPCIHLHLHRNNLKNNTLHDFRCKKQVKEKG